MDSSDHQSYHILNTGTFTYCLICMEDICGKNDLQSEENPVSIHLSGPNHQENVKFLFKLCIPDSIDDKSSAEDLFDIMKNSIFDISHLLGKKTCYICCKNKKHLVCVLCYEEVSKMELPCKKIKRRIITHLQGDRHLKSVKDTNWMYYFNSCKGFLRFHKSLLYCSICKESFRFVESSLLQFASAHLKHRHNVSYIKKDVGKPQDISQAKGETKTSYCIRVINFESNFSSSNSSSQSGSENSASQPSESCLSLTNKKIKSYICHLCLRNIEITEQGVRYSIDDHCSKYHLKGFEAQAPALFKDIICFNQRFLDQKLIVKKYPGIKVLSDCVPVFKNSSKYIQVFENMCFCSLCSVIVSFDSDPNNLLRHFSTHFKSVEHTKVLKRKGDTGYDRAFKKKKKDLKRLQLPKSEDSFPKTKKDTKKVKKKKVDEKRLNKK